MKRLLLLIPAGLLVIACTPLGSPPPPPDVAALQTATRLLATVQAQRAVLFPPTATLEPPETLTAGAGERAALWAGATTTALALPTP